MINITKTDKLTIAYITAGAIYGCHYLAKREYDFLLLAFVFLIISWLFSDIFVGLYSPNKHVDNPSNKHIFVLVSFVYAFLFLTYLKHYFMHRDYDYILLFVGYIISAILEYNIMTDKGQVEITPYENIRIFFLTLIACMYGKHAFSHDKYDYLILSGLYVTYAMLLNGSVGFKNQFDLVVADF